VCVVLKHDKAMLRLILIYYRQGPHTRAAMVQWSWWWETLTHCRSLIAGSNLDIVMFFKTIIIESLAALDA
jgi:hypothetical protein